VLLVLFLPTPVCTLRVGLIQALGINLELESMNLQVVKISFKDEDTLSDLLASSEASAQDIRDSYVARIKDGETIVAVIAGYPACALVLQSSLDSALKGHPSGDKLVAVPLA